MIYYGKLLTQEEFNEYKRYVSDMIVYQYYDRKGLINDMCIEIMSKNKLPTGYSMVLFKDGKYILNSMEVDKWHFSEFLTEQEYINLYPEWFI